MSNKKNLIFNERVTEYLTGQYGSELFNQILNQMSMPPIYSTIRVNTLSPLFSSTTSTSTSTSTTIDSTHVIMENARQLLTSLLPEEMTVQIHSTVKDCLTVPVIDQRESVEMLHDKVIVVDKKCGEAVLRGANVFSPGVLGTCFHLIPSDRVSVFADRWSKMKRGYRFENYQQLLSMNNINNNNNNQSNNNHNQSSDTNNNNDMMSERFIHVGNGRLLMDRRSIFSENRGIAIEMTEPMFQTPSFNSITEQYGREYFIQNLSSMIVSHLLDPKENETILDLCAAPGGKTSHIAILTNNHSTIYACDRHANKVQSMQQLFTRMNLTCIQPVKLDATKATLSSIRNVLQNNNENQNSSNNMTENTKKNKKKKKASLSEEQLTFDENSFDRVLVDAPCSGLGNRPTLSHQDITLEILQETAMYQRQILNEAVKLCKVGGTIVFSTCTVNPMENEENVNWLLTKYKNVIQLVTPDHYFFNHASYGLQSILPNDYQNVLRFCPFHNPESIGFFAAKFIKISSHSSSV